MTWLWRADFPPSRCLWNGSVWSQCVILVCHLLGKSAGWEIHSAGCQLRWGRAGPLTSWCFTFIYLLTLKCFRERQKKKIFKNPQVAATKNPTNPQIQMLKRTVACPPVLVAPGTPQFHTKLWKIPLGICKVTAVHQGFLHFPSADSGCCEVTRFLCNATCTPSIWSFFWQLLKQTTPPQKQTKKSSRIPGTLVIIPS